MILLKGKGTNLSKFEDSSRIMDDILSFQRTSSDKIGLGYVHKKPNKYSKSEVKKSNDTPKTYAVVLNNAIKRERNEIKTGSNQEKSPTPPKRYQNSLLDTVILAIVFVIELLIVEGIDT